MPHSKNANIRYHKLDRCFASRKRYYIEDLMKECGVSRRQIYDDIDYMKHNLDAPIVAIKDGKRVFHKYEDENFSIAKRPISENELTLIKELVMMLSRYNDIPQFNLIGTLIQNLEKDYNHAIDFIPEQRCIISLDANRYVEGADKIPYIYDAILDKIPLRIVYQTFHKGIHEWTIHPYFLKQYNNRWYLIGLNDEYNKITHIGLDRIKNVDSIHVPFIENTTIESIDEYFDDVVGVTIPPGRTIEHIVLKFSSHRYPYIKAKPIHWSQKNYDSILTVSLDLIPNKELESIIFSFGNDVEVIEPEYLREEIADKIRQLHQKYSPVQ